MNRKSPNNYNQNIRHNARGSRYKLPVQIVAAVIFVLILLRLVFPHALSGFFTTLFSPFWKVENAVASMDIFKTHGQLVAENAALQSQLQAEDVSTDAIAALEQENAELKNMLGRPLPKDTVLAAVLKQPPAVSYDTLVIDLGSDEHAAVGDKVFALASPLAGTSTASAGINNENVNLADENFADATSGDASSTNASTTGTGATASDVAPPALTPANSEIFMPVGEIVETTAETSKVELYSSVGTQYPVEIGANHIQATAVAEGGGQFEADVAQGGNIHVGDPVIVPSIDTVVFGTVGAIVSDPTKPYMSALFSEPVNIYELRWVEVATGQSSE